MSFISDLFIEISSFRIRVGNKLNTLANRIGVLNNLTTTNKNNLVEAVNEIYASSPINKANIDGSNTTGGIFWDIWRVLSSNLASISGNGQVFYQSGNSIYWGNPQLGAHIFEMATNNAMTVYSAQAGGVGQMWHAFNFNPVNYAQLSQVYTQSQVLALFVGLNGVQTIADTKTFTSSPIVPAGTLAGHTVNLGQMQAYVSSQIISSSGIERIETDNSSSPGPADNTILYFNFHEFWGNPPAFAENYQPGNATAKAADGQLDFFASYDSVHTIIENGGTAYVDMKGYHIVNVLLMSSGGDVHIPDGMYAGDQINITTLPNQQINIYTNNLITTMGNEVWTFANLVWDCEHTAWVMTGFGTP